MPFFCRDRSATLRAGWQSRWPVTLARALSALALAAVMPSAVLAQDRAKVGAQRVDTVMVELLADRAAVQPSGRLQLGLRLAHEPGWHTYWRNSGDSGLPTTVEPKGPDGSVFGPVRWPTPMRLWVGPLANYGYEGEVVLPFEVQLPAQLSEATVRFEAYAQWLVCKEVCIPGEARVALELPRAAPGQDVARSAQAAMFDAMAMRIPDPAHAVAAALHTDAEQLSVVFDLRTLPEGRKPARVEFFPYEGGLIAPAASQRLLRTEAGWRIDLKRADGARVPQTLQGVLWADDRPIELHGRAVSGPAAGGALVLTTAGPPATARPAATDGSRTTPSLLAQGRATGSGTVGTIGLPAPAQSGDGETSMAMTWLLGLLGGLLLNLMPCVFPVIGLKIIGFAQSSADDAQSRRSMRLGGMAFAAGVLASFWLLGGLMLALRAAGDAIGWGFQLQSAGFVTALALLFLLIGLNFSGLFEIGLGLTRLGNLGAQSSGAQGAPKWLGSFGSGVLAAIVATPCTAPFMGSALGLTLSQPAWQAMSVFTAIGLGMALPYLILGLYPAWLKVLPRPGRWMQTLREVLAFPMYASAAWLAWVLVQQAGPDALLRLLLAAVLLGAGAWAWGRFSVPPKPRPALAWSLVALCAIGIAVLVEPLTRAQALAADATGVGTVSSIDSPRADGSAAGSGAVAGIHWAPWSPAQVEAALQAGKPVFIDFTAAWCVTCQANKRLVLDRAAVTEAFDRAGVVRLRADWTRRDAQIAAELARYGRNGVPLYLLIRPGGAAPQVLSEILTVPAVLQALN